MFKITIDINEGFAFKKPKFFTKNIKKAAELAIKNKYNDGKFNISLLFCDDDYMKSINNSYRGKDYATNVLSFKSGEKIGSYIFLGDIAISIPTIEKEAIEQSKTFEEHLLHMFVHGVLHLLGYDHENEVDKNEMEKLEDCVLSNFLP